MHHSIHALALAISNSFCLATTLAELANLYALWDASKPCCFDTGRCAHIKRANAHSDALSRPELRPKQAAVYKNAPGHNIRTEDRFARARRGEHAPFCCHPEAATLCSNHVLEGSDLTQFVAKHNRQQRELQRHMAHQEDSTEGSFAATPAKLSNATIQWNRFVRKYIGKLRALPAVAE